MSLPNPSLPILDLTNGIDNQIVNAIVGYLQTRPVITDAFSTSIFPFYKIDIASKAMPAILVYPLFSSEIDQSYWHTGMLKIDIIIPVNVVKANKVQSALNISNWLLLLLKYNGLDWIRFNYPNLHGLQFLGFKNKQDYRKLYDENSVRSKLEIELEYKVNIQSYHAWLMKEGYDFSSPDVVIYEELNNILIDVQPQTAY